MRQSSGFDRLFIFQAALIACFALLALRLFVVAIVRSESYTKLASAQQLKAKEILPPRGKIYIHDFWQGSDKRSTIADTASRYQVSAVPRNIRDKQQFASTVAPMIGMDSTALLALIDNHKPYLPPLKRHLTQEEIGPLRETDLVGLLITPELARLYPENELAAQLVGFVDREGRGQYGVEGFYDDTLRGSPGQLVYERDIAGRRIGTITEEAAAPGTSYLLTIDRNVQFFLEKTLKEAISRYAADGGTIVVMQSATGGIVGAAASPSFDPNRYNTVKLEEQSRFQAPLIAAAWEPGSIFKPMIVAAGLDSEKITPEYKGVYQDFVTVQGFDIHRSVNRGPQEEDVAKILEFSDNVGMVDIANQIGNDLLYDYIEKFGFGKKLGIDLRGESPGEVPALRGWRDINRATISFGQGITTTPLQIVTAYSAIANNGRLVRPHLVDRIIPPGCDRHAEGTERVRESKCEEVEVKPSQIRQVMSPKTSEQMKLFLEHVVGHAYSRRAIVEGYKVGGKSGTAQVATPNGGYSSDETIQSFVGIGPLPDAPFVTLVRLDRPKNSKFAESSAAPTFSIVMRFLFQYYQLPPSGN